MMSPLKDFFSPKISKRIQKRVDIHTGLEYKDVSLKLAESTFLFQDGKWHTEKQDSREVLALQKQNQDLIEENNYLKLKIEVLLNMLAEATVKAQEQN